MSNTASMSNAPRLDHASAAFALSASIAIIFNTLLAWLKDTVPAVNSTMAAVSGHHWTTHSLLDLIVFLGLGFYFMSAGTADRMSGSTLIKLVIGSSVLGGLGLLGWFLIAG